jgi:drug/metabolite transporter (DMT)-like permease
VRCSTRAIILASAWISDPQPRLRQRRPSPEMATSARLRPHLFLIGANLIYGANYHVAKIALDGWIPPFGFIVLRVVTALLLFSAFHRVFLREPIARSDWPRLALCGLFGVAINQLLFFKGLSMTSEIHASLIMIATPLLVLLIAVIGRSERLNVRKALGVGLGALGLYWLVQQSAGPSSRTASVAGDLFILINSSSYGVYLVLVKPLMQRYHPLTVIRWVFFFGLFVVLPVGVGDLPGIAWGQLPLEVWGSIAYVLVATTFLSYLFNTMALREVNPSVVSIYIYTQPLVASLIAVLSGADVLHAGMLLSGLLIGSGVWLVSMPPGVWRSLLYFRGHAAVHDRLREGTDQVGGVHPDGGAALPEQQIPGSDAAPSPGIPPLGNGASQSAPAAPAPRQS